MEDIGSQFDVLLDVVIAAVLCSVIGGEREQLNKPAGLRTNMIVGSVACFFVSISPKLSKFIHSSLADDLLSVDPIRILQAIIVGISFIGAGTILKSKDENSVQNLTTSSTLLYSTGIGIAVSLKSYILAVGLTLIIVLINSLKHFNKLVQSFKNRNKDS